jgi:hypothetical protein
MSDEHVFGEWLKPFVKDDKNKFVLNQITVPKFGTLPAQQRIRAGTPLNSKVPVVCEPCNNGWLSRIHETAKPHLIPLIKGLPCAIGEEAQSKVATWATMATMTGEFIHRKPTSVAVSQRERRYFMHARMPLQNWRIWIGMFYPTQGAGSWIHAAMPIVYEGTRAEDLPKMGDGDVPHPNTQWSTFFVGRLWIHAASGDTAADYIQAWNWPNAPRARSLLVQIWPIKESIIVWPIQPLSDADAVNFATAHFHWLHNNVGRRMQTP